MQQFFKSETASQLGRLTALGATLSVLLMCVVFELTVPSRGVAAHRYLGDSNANFRSIILYATAGGIHILFCTLSIVFMLAKVHAEQPRLEFRRILHSSFMSFVAVALTIMLAMYLQLELVQQSYGDTVLPLRSDHRLDLLLHDYSIPLLRFQFEPFAVFPFSLILFGVLFSAVACFWAAHIAATFSYRADDLKKSDLLHVKRDIAQLITLLSVVFTTSCISTIIVMQIGRDWIEKGPERDAYVQNGYSMSIFWSACYTSIFLTILLIPLFWTARKTLRVRRQATFRGSKPDFFDPFYDVFTYPFLSKAGAAVLMPMITSSLAAVIGS